MKESDFRKQLFNKCIDNLGRKHNSVPVELRVREKPGTKEKCEFCGELEYVEGTTIVGCYCIDCHKINISQSREAIRKIKEKGKTSV